MSIKNNNEKLAELRDRILAQPKPPRGDRKSARQLNDQGLGYFKAERYAEAAQAFQQATQLDPSEVEIVNNIGYALLTQLSQPTSRIADFLRWGLGKARRHEGSSFKVAVV